MILDHLCIFILFLLACPFSKKENYSDMFVLKNNRLFEVTQTFLCINI